MQEIWIKRKPEYDEIINTLIEEEDVLAPLRASDIEIVCLLTNQVEITKTGVKIYAKTEKVPPKFQWSTTASFTITVFYPNTALFNEEQIKIMLFRELLKIVVGEDRDGSNKYKLRDFDLHDFIYIVERYGAGWANERTLFD